MQATKKNMERIEEVVPDCDYQSLHHFVSHSQWDERGVLDQVASDADRHLGGTADSCLLIDESAFPKKGKKSVGVARQWCGRLGKVENCQVAVFACLCRGPYATLIDTRLYLPKEWTQDPARCHAAGVPDEAMVTRSRADLAVELVQQARQNGVRFEWIGADGAYGKDPSFLRALDEHGETFVADIHKTQHIFLEDPEPFVPERKSPRGKPKRRVARSSSVRVDEWVQSQPAEAWQKVKVRDSSKGELRVEVLGADVWLWNGEEERAHCWRLVASREIGSPEKIKYALSNAPVEVDLARLVYMQRQRFWIERALEDAKSESGLGDYQVRGWQAWHHHMALVMMALLFMLEERLLQKEQHPLLTCSDIEVLLAHFLPRRDVKVEEVVRQMEKRHQARTRATQSAYRRQGLQPPSPSGSGLTK